MTTENLKIFSELPYKKKRKEIQAELLEEAKGDIDKVSGKLYN
jgi:hypothetical protein